VLSVQLHLVHQLLGQQPLEPKGLQFLVQQLLLALRLLGSLIF
jgi:hypothetical protein